MFRFLPLTILVLSTAGCSWRDAKLIESRRAVLRLDCEIALRALKSVGTSDLVVFTVRSESHDCASTEFACELHSRGVITYAGPAGGFGGNGVRSWLVAGRLQGDSFTLGFSDDVGSWSTEVRRVELRGMHVSSLWVEPTLEVTPEVSKPVIAVGLESEPSESVASVSNLEAIGGQVPVYLVFTARSRHRGVGPVALGDGDRPGVRSLGQGRGE